MREILFRGKRIDNGDWVEGLVLKIYNFDGEIEFYIHEDIETNPIWFEYEVDPETIGQYIGVKDTYGKKVFEDDIVEETYLHATNGRYVISYDESSFTYVNSKGWEDVIDDNEYGINIGKCKIVGNIHDNPELMEEKHNG